MTLYNYVDPKTGDPASLLAEDVHEIIQANAEVPRFADYLR